MTFKAWLLKQPTLKPGSAKAYDVALRGKALSKFASDAGMNGKLDQIKSVDEFKTIAARINGNPAFVTANETGRRLLSNALDHYEEYLFEAHASVSMPEEVPDSLWEGARRSVSINAFERNPRARAVCIEEHGAICAICGFDFGAAYGDQLKGYIHVHHIIPLSGIGKKYVVDPAKDLLPVCPNCHAALHHGGKDLTPEDVREMRERARKKGTANAAEQTHAASRDT